MTFGTGFVAASYSAAFKVRPMHIALNSPRTVQARIISVPSQTVLFEGTLLQKHEEFRNAIVKQFRLTEDVKIEVFEVVPHSDRTVLAQTIHVAGIELAAQSAANGTIPNVTIELSLDRFGLWRATKATARFPKIVKREVETNSTAKSSNETVPESNRTRTFVEEIVNRTESLEISVEYPAPGKMSSAELRKGLRALDSLETEEAAIRERAKAKNTYESLIYAFKDWLREDENARFVFPDAKSAWLQLLEEAETALYNAEVESKITTEGYANKSENLTSELERCKTRKYEYLMFNTYISAVREFVYNSTHLALQMRHNYTWLYKDDFQPIEKAVANLTEWVNNKTLQRNSTLPTSDPILTVGMLDESFFGIKMMFYTLFERVKTHRRQMYRIRTCLRRPVRRDVQEWWTCFLEDAPKVPKQKSHDNSNNKPEGGDKNGTKDEGRKRKTDL